MVKAPQVPEPDVVSKFGPAGCNWAESPREGKKGHRGAWKWI